jgi:hypothetical protein
MKWQQTDVDPRYSFSKATGALRNGPALGAVAVAYDLCYDGWDPAFRDRVRQEIEFYDPSKVLGPAKPGNCTLAELARGSKHGPTSNHWGPQLGGAALALLAIQHDPGVDQARVAELLEVNRAAIIRQLGEGQGDHGYFQQHVGPGQITSDTAFVPALQAWRVAGGVDFLGERPDAAWMTLRWAMWLLPTPRGPEYPNPVRKNSYGGEAFRRNGLSRGGQFAQGFGATPPETWPALLWTYEHCIRPTEAAEYPGARLAAGETSYDTVSLYPHRAVLALVNWPIGVEARNPGAYLPRQVSDARLQYNVFRNRWQDGDDIVVGALLGADNGDYFGRAERLRVWGMGRRYTASFPRPDGPGALTAHGKDAWSLVWPGAALTCDFRALDGTDAIVLTTGLTLTPDLPALQPGPLPAGFDPTGLWEDTGGVRRNCVREGETLRLYDTVRREGAVERRAVTLTIGETTMTGTVSTDLCTITWRQGAPWTRIVAIAPPLGPDEDAPLPTPITSLTGSWRTKLTATPVVNLVQQGDRLTIPATPIGVLTFAGTSASAALTPSAPARSYTLTGTVSACGNLIDWNGMSEWRRVGSPAMHPSPAGEPDDPKSRLTVLDMAGTRVTVLSFSAHGRHPTPAIDGGLARVGTRTYRLTDGRLVPDGGG